MKMHVIHISSPLVKASGATTFCVRIVEHLSQLNMKVYLIIIPKNQGLMFARNPLKKILIKNYGSLSVIKPDVVHAHSLWSKDSHYAIEYAYKNQIACVFSPHGMLAPWAMQHKMWKKKLVWWLYQKRDLKRVSMFHVTAECEIEWLRGLGFTQPCVIAPLGSDLQHVSDSKYQKGKQGRSVLFLGRIHPVKGLSNLIKAWSALKHDFKGNASDDDNKKQKKEITGCDHRIMIEGIPWQLIIAGPDEAGHKAELLSEAHRLGLTVEERKADVPMGLHNISQSGLNGSLADIIFTGAVYDLEKDAVYREADFFVLPSFTENFGAVVTDALAYGVPVIATKGTPWQELQGNLPAQPSPNIIRQASMPAIQACISGRCGWWIDIGSDALTVALKDAMTLSDKDRQKVGNNACRLVASKYTWPIVAAKMESAYSWLLNGDRKPDCVVLD